MFRILRNAWQIPELRRKIVFTLFIILIYRLGNAVPVPYVNIAALSQYFDSALADTVLGLYNAMSGNAFSSATIFALSIQPYINSSIIMQLLTIAIPALERMQKEDGDEGRKKLAGITRYLTVGLGLLMGYGYYVLLSANGLLTDTGFMYGLVIVLTFTAGSAFIMWLGEQVTEFGIGNGISMILFASIISRIPATIISGYRGLVSGSLKWYVLILILIGALLVVAFIIFISDSERRIPVQYAKRVVGRKMYGGQSTHLPIKVNMSGVMPIIFAQSIASLPATIAAFLPAPKSGFMKAMLGAIDTKSALYAVIYFLLIIGFSYFYSAVQYNPIEIANNLKKNGGFVPGFRPGRPTAEFIQKVLYKITLFGGLYLGAIAVLPIIMGSIANIGGLAIGGTSIIIVVGVAQETTKALEAQMLMRHYKGFLE